MTRPTRSHARLAAAIFPYLALVLLAPARTARAQTSVAPQDTSIDPQLFQPAIGPQNFLTVEGADVPDHKRLSFGLTLNYQQRPYTIFTQTPNGVGRDAHRRQPAHQRAGRGHRPLRPLSDRHRHSVHASTSTATR